jgi:hypothetical protein
MNGTCLAVVIVDRGSRYTLFSAARPFRKIALGNFEFCEPYTRRLRFDLSNNSTYSTVIFTEPRGPFRACLTKLVHLYGVGLSHPLSLTTSRNCSASD